MKRSDFIAGFVLLMVTSPGAKKREEKETIRLAVELADEMVRQGYLQEDEKQ